MTRTVVAPGQVAHLWAHQAQEHAKDRRSSIYFHGRDLYSYGPHYLIGRIQPDGAVLLNSDSNSQTTNDRRHLASSATSHLTQYHLPGLTELAKAIRSLEGKGQNATNKAYNFGRIKTYVEAKALSLSDADAVYLLGLTGLKKKDALAKFKKFAAAAEKAQAKREADKAKTEAKTLVELGAKLSKVAEKDETLIPALAGTIGKEDYGLKADATKLHHIHRALKKAKRPKQARNVYEVLKIVRAEVALRRRQAQRKQDNYHINENLQNIRSAFKSITEAAAEGFCISSSAAHQLIRAAENLGESSRVPVAVRAKLSAIAAEGEPLVSACRERERIEEDARNAAQIAKWRDGESGTLPYKYRYRYGNEGALLRAVKVERDASGKITGGTLQTSQSAEAPLTHAIRAFKFIKRCKERGEAWHRNGHSVRVGHFAIDSIEPNGDFEAGCHHVKWDEVEALARRLGVFDTAADSEALEPSQVAA